MNETHSEALPHIAGYEIRRRLGRGGMADVYLAEQSSLARPVAIKVLAVERTQGEETVMRFEQEARTIARLDHPNIVSIFDVGRTGDGRLYYVMPYLPNGDLSTRDLRDDEAGVIAILRSLTRALGYAHRNGIIHRDVKPENVLFDKLDRPLLADFGIALATQDFARVTREGSTIGSSGYMSPEQSRGFAIDGRSDLYSLGVVAYELLSGEMPFQGPDTLAVALAHVEQPIPRLPLRRRRWQPFIDKAMAKKPEERFQSAEQMEAALDTLDAQVGSAEPAYETKPLPVLETAITASRRAPATVVVAIVLTLAGAGMIAYAMRQFRHSPPAVETASPTPAGDETAVGPAPGAGPAPAPLPGASGGAPAGAEAAGAAADSAGAEVPAPAAAAAPPKPPPPPAPRVADLVPGQALRDRGGPLLSFVPAAKDGGAAAHAFALARRDVTRGEYAEFVSATGRQADSCREPHSPLSLLRKLSWREPGFDQDDAHPVVCVSWQDANAYTQWLSQRTHARYRLPTHAEWLQALHAGARKADACALGNLADDKRALFHREETGDCSDGFEHTAPVGKFRADRLGLYDMVGNVSTWTLDCKGGDATHRDDGQACPQRMFSGLSWRDDTERGVDSQDDADADAAYTTIGFRVLREISDDDLPALVK